MLSILCEKYIILMTIETSKFNMLIMCISSIFILMLQSSVMLYRKSTNHKLVRDARAGLWVRKPVKQTQRFQSMASKPWFIFPLNQRINRPSCGRSVPVNWEGTNWTILRTQSALWLITLKSDIHLTHILIDGEQLWDIYSDCRGIPQKFLV